MIPLCLLEQLIDLLESWDVSDYSPYSRFDYDSILWLLNAKKQKAYLRQSYAKMVDEALSDEAREYARRQYLNQKALCDDLFDGEPF